MRLAYFTVVNRLAVLLLDPGGVRNQEVFFKETSFYRLFNDGEGVDTIGFEKETSGIRKESKLVVGVWPRKSRNPHAQVGQEQ